MSSSLPGRFGFSQYFLFGVRVFSNPIPVMRILCRLPRRCFRPTLL